VVIGQKARCNVARIAVLHFRFDFERIAGIHGSKNRRRRDDKNDDDPNSSHVTNSPKTNWNTAPFAHLRKEEPVFMPVSDTIYNAEVQKM
jgi:hypothetical protein